MADKNQTALISDAPPAADLIDYGAYQNSIDSLRAQYQQAQEFPNIVFDDFLIPATADQLYDAFLSISNDQWSPYFHINENKFAINKLDALPSSIRQVILALNSETFLALMRDLTGIPNLVADPSLQGAGLHQIRRGGFLNIHADFTAHPHHTNWRRRINLIIYLNKDWHESYGGHLEFWARDMSTCFKKTLPVFNRCVIFNTDQDSYHGHPYPLTCPENMTRKSIALYYYTEEANPPNRSTDYQSLPEYSLWKRILIRVDNGLLKVYSTIKRALRIDDDLVTRCMKIISGRRKN